MNIFSSEHKHGALYRLIVIGTSHSKIEHLLVFGTKTLSIIWKSQIPYIRHVRDIVLIMF